MTDSIKQSDSSKSEDTKSLTSVRRHLFPESNLHHLSNCWCDKAVKWRKVRRQLDGD